jgi:pyruvate-ferredoxin/flavodoxin oxidoreductase
MSVPIPVFFVLQARNVQEAVDFSLIARRVSELTLIPGLVAMDGEQTALAAQEVHLPHPDLVQQFLGAPDEQITAPTPAQKLLFGEKRRRVPRWHDPDRPIMQGAMQGSESWALGAVAKHPYFNHHLDDILEESFALLSKMTSRTLESVSSYQTDNAKIVLIAQGAAIETFEAVADYMRSQHKLKVGVLGIHGFRPFPGAMIAKKLVKKQIVAVMERVDTPLAVDPPLMRQVRASLERAMENGRLGTEIHSGYPLIKEQQLPRFRSVVYGLGGQALRAADLVALCENLEEKGKGRIFLGFEFARASSIYPKRQVLLDNLRRSYPDIAELGLRSQEPSPDLRPADALTVAIHNLSDQKGKGLAVEAAVFMQRLLGGCIRSRPALFRERWISGWTDIFTHAPTALRDPGDDLPIDIMVLTAPHRVTQPILGLRKEGILLAISPLDDAALWQSLSPAVRENIQNARLYCVSPIIDHSPIHHILGGLFGVLLNTEQLEMKKRRILSAYEENLHHLPKIEQVAQLKNFEAGLETVRQIDYQNLSLSQSGRSAALNDDVPMAVRHLGHSGEAYDSLPRFWDQVGVLYRNGETAEMMPDPYMATGIIPPLTSTFRDISVARERLPVFDPNSCTGCGDCWTSCPESAIGSVVISPTTLIEAGIRLAGADSLRMAASKLVSRLHSLARNTEITYSTAGEFIQEGFAALKDKLPLNDERKVAVSEAVELLVQQIGELQIARTEPFFYEQERFQHETGEFLSLVINPDACKACGLCIAACEPKALSAVPQTEELVAQTHKYWRLWEKMPDTSGKTIERASEHLEVGKMQAILLSRYCQLAVAGGDNAEAGSGEKLAVRLALAVTEFQRQPLINRFIKEIAEVRDKLMASIRDTLASALPTDDLDMLAKGLDTIHPSKTLIVAITEQVEEAAEHDLIDASRLRRLVKTSQALGKLHWQLSKGRHGLGRARLSLAIAPGTITGWAGSWPDNPFQVPVTVDMLGDTAQLAGGLLEGQLREATEGIALLRQARLELEKPDEAARATPELLNWRDLSKEEQQICPPLLLLGNDDVLDGKGFSGMTRLLNEDLPVKIMVLADLDLNLGTANVAGTEMAVASNSKINLGLLALSQQNAYIVQTSIAETTHFLDSVKAAFQFEGPALIYVHAPSPERHGFSPEKTVMQASQAVKARVFPLFRYNPDENGVFGSRISLEGNPDPDEAWSNEEEIMTPADWAAQEKRFAPYFSPLKANDPAPLPVAEYLELDTRARQKKTPFVSVIGEEGEPVRLKVGSALVAACEERFQAWRTLQELAGVVTPFTAAVENKLKAQLTDAHQAELAALKQEYEARIEKTRAEMETEMAARVKEQLMGLAGYNK